MLWNKKSVKLRQSSIIQTPMLFAFVAAVGGVGLENVAVASLQLFQYGGLVDDTGSTVVGECAIRDERARRRRCRNM